MGERTGLDPMEVALLRAMGLEGAGPDDVRAKTERILRRVEADDRYGPARTFDALVELSSRSPVQLVDLMGGWPPEFAEDPLIAARFNEARLTEVGDMALRSEQGELPPLPLNLIGGSMYRGGERPPFDASVLVDAILSVAADPDLSDEELIDRVGGPAFPQGCDVIVDTAALHAGEQVVMRLYPQPTVRRSKRGSKINLRWFPPHLDPAVLAHSMRSDLRDPQSVLKALGVTAVADRSRSHLDGDMRLVLSVAAGVDPDQVIDRLRGLDDDVYPQMAGYGISIGRAIYADMGAPTATLLRQWVQEHLTPESSAALRRLRDVLDDAAARRAHQHAPTGQLIVQRVDGEPGRWRYCLQVADDLTSSKGPGWEYLAETDPPVRLENSRRHWAQMMMRHAIAHHDDEASLAQLGFSGRTFE